MVAAQHDEVLVPGFENYSFTRAGELRRISGGSGAELGIKKPNRHYKQPVYQLFQDRKRHFFSKAAMMALVFGDEWREHTAHHQGEQHYKAKLTDGLVRHIRTLSAQGLTPWQIAAEIGHVTNASNIRFVVTRKTWKHIQ
jgi:hypothetical protein